MQLATNSKGLVEERDGGDHVSYGYGRRMYGKRSVTERTFGGTDVRPGGIYRHTSGGYQSVGRRSM